MEVLSFAASLAAVAVAGLAAWWSRQAAKASEVSAAKVEHGLAFRWACEQAGSTDPQIRAAGVAALTVMLDSDVLSSAELRLFKAVGAIFVRDPAAYAGRALQAGTRDPAPGGAP